MHDRYDELMARLAALEGLVCSMAQMAALRFATVDHPVQGGAC